MILNNQRNKKIKVVWLCYFNNQFVQDRIKPWKRTNEFAPWITSMIPLFENDLNLELHIVSQHEWICGYKNFKYKGVTYHFFNAGIPIIGRHWPWFFKFDQWTDFIVTKMHIARIVKKIKPDIIHLHGAENKFCSAITQFYNKYPVFITIQGFIHKSSEKNKQTDKRIQKELEILKMFNHFGYRTETMGKDIKALNNEAVLHWHNYPTLKIKPIKVDKKYDLVFFARVSKEKGIGDLLQAVSIIKREKSDISLCVIGGGDLAYWKAFALELNISENVYWAGFLPTQQDVHKLASTARISVLPTYHDIIPGTIVESLFLKLPVVAYDVGSIHEINRDEKIICLVELFDIENLAKSIQILLDDEKLREKLAMKGYKYANEMFTFENHIIKKDLQKAYNEIINEFYQK